MKVDGLFVYHLVARIEVRDVSLVEFDLGCWIWERLRVAFPQAFGSSLMPDHKHLLTPLADPIAGQQRMNRLLGRLACRLGVRFAGEAAAPKRIADRDKLQRELRYIGLNAPRKKLTTDPLAWVFSTHRDVIGASVDPWVDAGRLARALGRPRRGFERWYQQYVSGDPSVRVAGTPLPSPAVPSDLSTVNLGTIAVAAAAATRSRPEAIRTRGPTRDLFVGLALEHGWRDTTRLAEACACTARAIQQIAARIDPQMLAPARLCLGDARLRHGIPSWRDALAHGTTRRRR